MVPTSAIRVARTFKSPAVVNSAPSTWACVSERISTALTAPAAPSALTPALPVWDETSSWVQALTSTPPEPAWTDACVVAFPIVAYVVLSISVVSKPPTTPTPFAPTAPPWFVTSVD